MEGMNLGAAAELYRALFEHTGVGLIFVAEDTTVLLANKEFEQLSGYSRDEVEGKRSWTFLIATPEDLERMVAYHKARRVDPSSVPSVYETKIRNSGGEVRDIALRVTMIPGTTNSLASFNDITEQKRAAEAIRASEARLRGITRNIPGVVFQFLAKANGEIGLTYVSDRMGELFGVHSPAEELFWLFVSMVHEEDRPRFMGSIRAAIEEIAAWSFEGRLVLPSGARIWFHAASTPTPRDGDILFDGLLLDITEKRRLEEERRALEHQLSQSQKMDAIGQLAGGVAHDFNNILTGIQGNACLMLKDLPADHPHRRKLEQIDDHVRRGANLTRQLLGFARGGKYELKTRSIGDLARRTLQLFLETRKDIEADVRSEGAHDLVEMDVGQIEQVLLNLYINAGHAMASGGRLRVRIRDVALEDPDAKALETKPGRYVEMSVTDTGVGMAPETLKRIFEPFFTTRGPEGGTGLGLASAYGIIRNHGGAISASSELGAGSRIRVLLPASDKRMEQESSPSPAKPIAGAGSILLVDDEPLILETACALLEELGYTVRAVSRGADAVAAYREARPAFDLVILDMVMPAMTGPQVLEALREIDPGVPVLLSSGYGLQAAVRDLLDSGCLGFIQKPFGYEELSRAVQEALGKRSSRRADRA